jgi:tRNA(Ile2) C34 agmatinyltransferase TiaS
MHLGPQLVVLMTVTTVAGWLMIESGVFKHLLDRRRHRRVCPSCGRNTNSCGCF